MFYWDSFVLDLEWAYHYGIKFISEIIDNLNFKCSEALREGNWSKVRKTKMFHFSYNVVIYMGWIWEFIILFSSLTQMLFKKKKKKDFLYKLKIFEISSLSANV